jgi:hypothetical protein
MRPGAPRSAGDRIVWPFIPMLRFKCMMDRLPNKSRYRGIDVSAFMAILLIHKEALRDNQVQLIFRPRQGNVKQAAFFFNLGPKSGLPWPTGYSRPQRLGLAQFSIPHLWPNGWSIEWCSPRRVRSRERVRSSHQAHRGSAR